MSPRRPFPLTATIPALACALVLLAGTPAWASDSPAEFKGKIGKTLADSEEYWPPPVTPPEGAPNVLIWLIDDMGYGHSSAFGGLTPMSTIERRCRRGVVWSRVQGTHLQGSAKGEPEQCVT
jgi:arylsulfatase